MRELIFNFGDDVPCEGSSEEMEEVVKEAGGPEKLVLGTERADRSASSRRYSTDQYQPATRTIILVRQDEVRCSNS